MIHFTNSLAAKLFEIEYTVFFTAIYVDYVDRILARPCSDAVLH